MKRIGVIGLCQAWGIGNGLFHLLEDAEVFSYTVADLTDSDRFAEAEKTLAQCDVVFAHYLPDDYGSLSTEFLKKNTPNFIAIPTVIFTGFHPDCFSFNQEETTSFPGYHSAIIAASYSIGLLPDQVLPLFNKLVFKKLGYYDEYFKSRLYLAHVMASHGLDITEEWSDWVASGIFMHTINHPKPQVMASLAKLLAIKAGLVVKGTPTPDVNIDFLGSNQTWPVYPEIAEAFGAKGSYVFSKVKMNFWGGSHSLLSLRDFIDVSYERYASAPVELFEVDAIAKVRSSLLTLPFA